MFNESKNDYITKNRTWHLGPSLIDECECYTHLGIIFNRVFTIKYCIEEACRKLRGTLFSLINCGVNRYGMNPLSSKSLYKSVVLPRALYGSALWNDMTQTDSLLVELAHRFCVNYMQDLGTRTKTRLTYHLLNIQSIDYDIDRNKLVFLGQLCNMPCNSSSKQIFVNRLTSYEINASYSLGFIPDISSILRKYGLSYVLSDLKNSGVFPSKYQWKRCVKVAMNNRIDAELHVTDDDTKLNEYVINSSSPSVLWTMVTESSRYLGWCRTTARMLGQYFYNDYSRICHKCGISTNKAVLHFIYECNASEDLRRELYRQIFNKCGVDTLNEFISLDVHIQIAALFWCNRGLKLG